MRNLKKVYDIIIISHLQFSLYPLVLANIFKPRILKKVDETRTHFQLYQVATEPTCPI